MKTRFFVAVGWMMLTAFAWVGCGPREMSREGGRLTFPELRPFDNGAIALMTPADWQMAIAGDCSSLAFVLQDPREPLRKIMFFGLVGPVYQSPMQKQIDHQYMSMGGYPVEWADMPVVAPLTPENLLAHFSQIASSQVAQRFMPGCPRLERFQIVSSTPRPPAIASPEARAALVRGVFTENGRVGQGLFSLTTAPFMPMMGGPGGGTAYGFQMIGMTAPMDELDAWHPWMAQVLASFSIHPSYVQSCMQRSEAAFGSVMRAGQTLRETSDMIHESWKARNRSDDILAAKRSDAILGRERLYDPGTGEVYEFQNGFSSRYRLHPQEYRNPNLQPLPDGEHGLWTSPTRDGYRALGL